MKMTKEELGEFFRELRKARGFTLKDIANEQVTVAQLSKFERGETVLSFDRLFSVLDAMNLTIEEFSYAYNNYEKSEYKNFRDKVYDAYSGRNVLMLENILKEYENKEETIHNRVRQAIIKSKLRLLNRFTGGTYEIDQETITFISDYLMSVEEWTFFEIQLFDDFVYSLNFELVNLLAREMLNRSNFYSGNLLICRLIVNITINVYGRAIVLEDKKNAIFYRNRISDLLEKAPELIDNRLTFTHLNYLFDYIFNKNEDALKQMYKMLEYLKGLGLDDIANYMEFETNSIKNYLEDNY